MRRKLEASLAHHQVATLVISKNKSRVVYDSIINKVSFKEEINIGLWKID